MPILAKQPVSETALKWIISEAKRLNCSRAEIVRRLLDVESSKVTKCGSK